MANLSFNTSNQIIRDLYDTAADAIQAAKALGCDGYRTYIINGVTKYVPCTSYVQYEKALRYRVVQGVIGSFGSDTFGDKLVGLQFANSKDEIQGDPYFTLGNFSVNLPPTSTINTGTTTSITNDAVKSYTIQNIVDRNLTYFTGKPYVEAVQQLVTDNVSVDVLFDPRKLDNYVLFSSLQERVKNTLVEIFNAYPGAIKVRTVSISNPSITNYVTYRTGNRSQMKVSLYGLSNPFGIKFTAPDATLDVDPIITQYRNFAQTYANYVIYYNGVEYPILSVTLPQSINDVTTGLNITIQGDPFSSIVDANNRANISFYIKPKQSIYDTFFSGLSDLAAFFLTKDENTGDYTSEFIYPSLSDNGVIVNTKETVFFPKYDDFNIDMFGDNFDKYTSKLNDLAASYDNVKTNLIVRFLTADTLKEFDTEDRKAWLMFQLYGKQFDDIKKYIDGITFMTNASYNKIENIPDLLIKNFAHMLGFETYELEDDDTLIDSLFGTTSTSGTTTPAEVDIELWRRMLINASYLFKSKGTRKSIEFILKLVGFPDELFDLNEYVYVAEKPVNVIDVLNKIYTNNPYDDPTLLLTLQPFDGDGYPTVPLNIAFQEAGGSITNDKYNIGPFDFGQSYINAYKKSGSVHLFELERTVDNLKSWVLNTSTTERVWDDLNGYTNYVSDDTRLTINSKEFEVYLALNRVMDVSIYRQYVRNIGVVNANLSFTNNLAFDPTNLSFNEFLVTAINNFINPTNRKTIRTYPTLSKIYFDYLDSVGTPMDSIRSLDFLGRFDTNWVTLVQQFVPATTITNAGKKVQNSSFNDNKFVYRHGKNSSVSWLGTDGSEFQQKALKPVYVGATNVSNHSGDIFESIVGNSPSFIVTGKQGTKVIGIDNGINQYFGVYYTMKDFCDESNGTYYMWESGVDYGNDSVYGGNINAATYTGTPKNGVFAIYNNKLYRLNTRVLFNTLGLTSLHTTGITTSLPPNVANITYGGVTQNIWDEIHTDADTRVITFQDTVYNGLNSTERSFYMNSIGIALAYIQTGIAFDCPPPQPHICYFNFGGNSVNMITYTGVTYRSFVDNTGATVYVKQPKFYGFSKNMNLIRPSELSLGSVGKWTTPYQKVFDWQPGNVYYQNEIVGRINPTDKTKYVPGGGGSVSNLYVVTGATVTGTTSMAPGILPSTGLKLLSTIDGTGHPTVTTGITGGMYGTYDNRTTTDPFMQVENAYIQNINILDPTSSTLTINLSKALNLVHIFSGLTPSTTYRVTDNIINDQIYISDLIGINIDGLYPVDPSNVGPFYTPLTDNIFLHTLGESLPLTPNNDNLVSIQSLNSNFTSVGDDISLIVSNPGYYLITKSSFLTFDFTLYFESDANISQSVFIRLINSKTYLYDEQEFTFNGSDTADNRQYTFHYQGFFTAGDKVYLNIIPQDTACTLSRYETIDYTHIEPDESTFSQLDDPRFRVLFNSGFVANKYGYTSEGLGIKPIYNLTDFNSAELKLNTGTDSYTSTRVIEASYSLDPTYMFNVLFLDYYRKFTTGGFVTDSTPYDKLLGNDKVDFSFTVRSKDTNISIPTPVTVGAFSFVPGVNANTVSYDFSYTDYYLGNVNKMTEYTNIDNVISIGKNVRRRVNNYNKAFVYYPNKSFYNGVALGSGSAITTNYFTSYDDGLSDFSELVYTGDFLSELRKKRRYYYGILSTTGLSAFNYYQTENQVYSNEIYQDILNTVPEFNSLIVNYELNDIVKVLVTNYPIVSGSTVVHQDIYKLYVCINDIHLNHCYKDKNMVQGQIHEIYQPRGARSCFIELERYNPANFTPWGYESKMINGLPNPNVIDYVYKGIVSYDPTLPMPFTFGDILVANYNGNNEYFRYIYQKPTTYDHTTPYIAGDFFTSGVTEGSSIMYRYFFAKTNLAPGAPINSTNWTKLTNELFDHRSLSSNSIGVSGVTSLPTISSWIYFETDATLNYSSTAARLPKTLPVTTGGTPIIVTGTTGLTTATRYFGGNYYGNRWNDVLLRDRVFIDTSYNNLDNYEIINTNKIFKNRGVGTGATYSEDRTVYGTYFYKGSTTGIAGTNYYLTDTYTDNYNIPRTGVTNIFLEPGVPNNATKTSPTAYNTTSVFVRPIQGESLGLMPLFERLGRENERNCPQLWIPSSPNLVAYDNSSAFIGTKYAVNRGVLYEYVNPTAVTVPSGLTLQPCFDTTNWAEKDFCLVNNFTYYKDRTRVIVYESSIQALTTGATSNMYFFNPNLSLKNGFTSTSFSGTTINNQLIGAMNKFYDVTDPNRTTALSHGSFNFRMSGTDILMDYTYEKDPIGYPLTGEFIGRMNVYNPCGQSATTFFGMLFNTNVNNLNRQRALSLTPVLPSQAIAVFPYTVRVIINQSSSANVTVKVTTADANSLPIVDNQTLTKYQKFDKKYSVIPQTDLVLTVSYSTNRKQTTFNSGRIDNLPVFVNDAITNTNFVQTNISNDGLLETRTITLLNISNNTTVNLNLSGIETVTTDVIQAQAVFNVKNININTSQL